MLIMLQYFAFIPWRNLKSQISESLNHDLGSRLQFDDLDMNDEWLGSEVPKIFSKIFLKILSFF